MQVAINFPAVAEHQPVPRGASKTAMTRLDPFSNHAARVRDFIRTNERTDSSPAQTEPRFNKLSLDLFALQFQYNATYRRLCEARNTTPDTLSHWSSIPAAPAAAFKELELTSLPPAARTAVFHSSGTTQQQLSRHFHSAASLALYEESLRPWFAAHLLPDRKADERFDLLMLTPPPALAPHSSLAHMFETVRRDFGSPSSRFVGQLDNAGAWILDSDAALAALENTAAQQRPLLLLGTAFLFVNLLDALDARSLRFTLPAGSRVMETGGYKGRARVLPQIELYALITDRLGVPASGIVCEYGMSELSSQAYDRIAFSPANQRRHLFPPWARVQIVSPETGREVSEGEPGLLRILDLANTWSVLAVQTEDLAIRRGEGFELIGRADRAEVRGCSLMTA
ncbi:MAG: long-chain fatty acid--CoA ligase [Pedosphaera sp.]|nr:long-chain fatty acid--CoA ligase [Pedosphaera sp.]